jgi:hypothetical protein
MSVFFSTFKVITTLFKFWLKAMQSSKPHIKSMALIPMISLSNSAKCLGLFDRWIVKSENQDAFIQNKIGVTRR